MAYDAHRNLASSTIVTAPTPATSGTEFVVTAGEGALFAANMPVTLVPSVTWPTQANAEIGYLTSIVGNTLTIIRAQEGTTAKPVDAGWVVMGSITAKTLSDIEAAVDLKADTSHTHVELHTHTNAAVLNATTASFTTADGVKLAGVASGATANDTDANLKARANHSGTQTAATISDFDTEVSNNTDVAANTSARHTHSNSAVLNATTASFTTADETKLDGIAAGAQVNTVTSVASKTGVVTLDKADVGLANVDNTSDASKPISTATQTALDGKSATAHTHALAAGATDVTASAAELNILDGATLSTTELNYLDGVTSAVQTQLNAKVGGTTTITVGTTAPGSPATGDLWVDTN